MFYNITIYMYTCVQKNVLDSLVNMECDVKYLLTLVCFISGCDAYLLQHSFSYMLKRVVSS